MKQLRECPFSGELFKPKRSNQKFASSKNRIAYYNQQYRQKRLPLERINQKLFYNYSILEIALDSKQKVLVSKDFLIGRGYNFDLLTHLIELGNYPCFGLYNIRITRLDNNQFQIQKDADTDI
ncbi:hypothetical protein [Psychroflexus planctonicus]|uniref:Uncharacterized protein n=1 Tax=Psychroflexus planctonicus TaxID=1526575 RepID=A0ABQ1SDP5_9FLAO|nr:hypothetical protein [Psychroflexus planctonicus]GGE31538.1 hypothetical protein GCM10010832_09890 [Psychroflexus planctonicus]